MAVKSGFSDDYKMSDDDTYKLAALIAKKDFRLVEDLIQWEVALLTDRAMSSGDQLETEALKGGVSALKNFTVLLQDVYRKGQIKEQRDVLEITKNDKGTPTTKIF